jgi:hypothetical protein
LVDIQDSEDPEGLRVFYYLVQDLKVVSNVLFVINPFTYDRYYSVSYSRSFLCTLKSNPYNVLETITKVLTVQSEDECNSYDVGAVMSGISRIFIRACNILIAGGRRRNKNSSKIDCPCSRTAPAATCCILRIGYRSDSRVLSYPILSYPILIISVISLVNYLVRRSHD